jgi:hypothetical protein
VQRAARVRPRTIHHPFVVESAKQLREALIKRRPSERGGVWGGSRMLDVSGASSLDANLQNLHQAVSDD